MTTDKLFEEDWNRHRMTNKEARDLDMYEFKCSSCNSKDIEVLPSGVPFLNPSIDNKDLHPSVRRGLEAGSNRLDIAVLKADEIFSTCNKCGFKESILASKICKQKVTTWFNRFGRPLDLGVDRDDREESHS